MKIGGAPPWGLILFLILWTRPPIVRSNHPDAQILYDAQFLLDAHNTQQQQQQQLNSEDANSNDIGGEDEKLTFTRVTYNVSIPENSVGKTYVAPEERMGIVVPDASLIVRYKIVGGDKEKHFKAEAHQVGSFWYLLVRRRTEASAVLNREYQDEYRLRIRASVFHSRRPQKKLYDVHCEVLVTVLDKNDISPLFYPRNYNVTLPEDTPLHKAVLKVNADDPDTGVNGEIYYSLLEPTLQFAIHPTLGTLFLTRPLDFRNNASYELSVIARDRGPKPSTDKVIHSSAARVSVRVDPVNKHKPRIDVRHLESVIEQDSPDTWAVVQVTDADIGVNGQIAKLEIVDGNSEGQFHVEQSLSKHGEFNIYYEPVSGLPLNSAGYTLVLRAWDKGTPPLSSDKTVFVKVSDLSGLVPVFNQSEYDVDIDEVAPYNTPLLIVHAELKDLSAGPAAATDVPNSIYYHVETGDKESVFSINPRTGLISTRRPLDREQRKYYSLTISATNTAVRGQRSRITTTIVNIRVLDCNDNAPIFNESSAIVSIEENRPVGSLVYKVYASDRDEQENGYVSYALANINRVPFTIDPFSGEIRTTDIVDFETMRRDYVLRIRATDWGSPFQRQAEMSLRVQVRDVNDHRPVFETVNCAVTVSRKAPIGTEVLTLSAVDQDEAASGAGLVTYKMDSNSVSTCFSIDSTSGSIRVRCDLSSAKDTVLNITATDGQHFADPVHVKVRIINNRHRPLSSHSEALHECKDVGLTNKLRNQLEESRHRFSPIDEVNDATLPSFFENRHAPEFVSLRSEIVVNESLPVGAVVLDNVEARDADHGFNGKLLYAISSGNEDSCFSIGLYTGQITLLAPLDREKTSRYVLNITAYDMGEPQHSTSKTLIVSVADANDNIPVFERSSYNFEIVENAANGTSIAKLKATDKDEGYNSQVEYMLQTDTQEFRLDRNTGVLLLQSPLDRERQETYNMVVQAIDRNPMSPLTGSATISIKVSDINDNAPQFSLPMYIARVREDMPLGVVIMTMSARDPDLKDGGRVDYSMIGDHRDTFNVDPENGVIRLVNSLDFEKRQIYNVTVKASDRGTPPLFSTATLLVEVEDVNENLFAPKFGEVVINASVVENAPINTLVTTVKATDDDAGAVDSTVTYSLVDGDGIGVFQIDNNGEIRTKVVLDCESKSSYWLTVVAQDRAAVPLSSRLDVYIQVVNINDNVPLSRVPFYDAHVEENSPANVSVVRIEAFDLDKSSETALNFKLTSGNPQGFFRINSTSGEIFTTERSLDRETLQQHVLEVVISDQGEPVLSSTVQVLVVIDDVNDHAPKFAQTRYQFRVLAPPADIGEEPFELVQVAADDPDAGRNSELEYSLEQGSNGGKIQIDSRSGIVRVVGPLALKDLDLTIKVSDGGNPALSSVTYCLLSVFPRPTESLHPPKIEDVESSQVLRSEKIGTQVAAVTATDNDRQPLYYRIASGNEGNYFMMRRPDAGIVILAKSLLTTTKTKFDLTIEVTDGVDVASTKINVTILNDVDYEWPSFAEPVYRVQISENIHPGTDIVRLTPSARDVHRKLFFSLHNSANPNSLSKFSIGSTSGVLQVKEALDHEMCRAHLLTALLKDHAHSEKRAFVRIQITVTDHNDHAPEFVQSRFEGKVFETAAVGTSVLRVRAIDRDKERNAHITYSIVSGNVGSSFNMHSLLGTVSVAKELNQQTLPEYFLTVRATDSGEPSLNSTSVVHIKVTIANNAPPKFTSTQLSVEIAENLKVGSPVAALTASSRASLYFEIMSGNQEGKFFIDQNSGVITLLMSLDFETTRVYNLTVRATSLVGSWAESNAMIHVTDINDNAPFFLQHDYVGFISEGADRNSVILTESGLPLVVKAKDLDSDVNSLLTFTIVDLWARKLFRIDPSTGSLKIIGRLDREESAQYRFRVQVTDGGRPRLAAQTSATVVVNVLDINDSAPKFERETYNATVMLPTYEGIVVAHVKATDADLNSSDSIRYHFTANEMDGIFEINETTGVVTIRRIASEINEPGTRQIVISATDGDHETMAMLVVTFTPLPVDSRLRFTKSVYEASFFETNSRDEISSIENSVDGKQIVAIVSVVGSSLNEHVKYKLLNGVDRFVIGATSGAVRLLPGGVFDREQSSTFRLVVEATAEDAISHAQIHVTLKDVNDNAPIFVNRPYHCVVPIEAKRGDLVRKVEAIDSDAGENSVVRYYIKPGPYSEVFRVDPTTGTITLKDKIDPALSSYEVIIIAKDSGTPPLTSEVIVPIRVVSRAQPSFTQQFYSVRVPENHSTTSPVITVKAESPKNRQLIYSIVGGNHNEEFTVDFATDPTTNGPCVIYVTESLDFETESHYELTLRATDSVTGSYADVSIDVTVEDVNDHAPVFEKEEYTATVSEVAAVGTSVIKVSSTDVDTGANGRVQYSLQQETSGNLHHHHQSPLTTSLFHIDPDTGVITVKRLLDHEKSALHHLVVIATDNGSPRALSSTTHVWIHVLDINDMAPVWDRNQFACAISQLAQRDHFVCRIVASDPDSVDSGRLEYAIVGGNEGQAFALNRHTGVVTLSNVHPFQHSLSSYLLNVSVTDGVYASHSRLKITVTPANQKSPKFQQDGYVAVIQEEIGENRALVRVSASDTDSSVYGLIEYEIASEECAQVFRIDKSTGELFATRPLDRETRNTYNIPIRAFDGGYRLAYTTVKVTVTDVNDYPPAFPVSEYRVAIKADTAMGNPILKIRAYDKDEGLNGAVHYSLHDTPSNVTAIFGITHDTGDIYLKKSPKESSVYQFFVKAHDLGEPSLEALVPVMIDTLGSEEVEILASLQVNSAEKTYYLRENAPVGTHVASATGSGNMSRDSTAVSGQLPVQFSIVTAPETGPFHRDATQFSIDDRGSITLVGELDRERQAVYRIAVRVAASGRPHIGAFVPITVWVLDQNDNAPTFDSATYRVRVAENIEEGARLIKVTATDLDIDSNAKIRYEFYERNDPAADIFHLDPDTGWITNLVPLDRESVPFYNFTIMAKDAGRPQQYSTATVFIQVADYNDNPPTFRRQLYDTTIPEDTKTATEIISLEVQDADEPPGPDSVSLNPVYFYILSGDPEDQFGVTPTGDLFVKQALDRESIDRYELRVIATDGLYHAETTVSIVLSDSNDNAPVCSKFRYEKSILESAPLHTPLFVIEATDRDDEGKSSGGESGKRHSGLKYYLTGKGADDFSVNASTGMINVGGALDREHQSVYNLVAHVQDYVLTDWECTSEVVIRLLDVNDNPPSFSQEMYSVSVPEDVEVGTLLTKIHATDPDLGINRKVSYTLVDSSMGHFEIDRHTGIIQLMRPLDREEKAMYNLTVEAMDHGVPPLSSQATILVLVQDINDNPPEFSRKFYVATVPEDATMGTELIQVHAQSKDSGINAEITYFLDTGNAHDSFSIHPKTGSVRIARPLDFETTRHFVIAVMARDGGTPALSSMATLNISVTDANDNPPAFSQQRYSAIIREDAVPGDRILQILATDADSGDNAVLKFKIMQGDRHGQFAIDTNTGYISLAAPLDREQISNYVLEVECADGGTPSLTSKVLVNIEISDVNDNAPQFGQSNYSVIVQEGTPPDTTVLQLSVSDLDSAVNGAPFVLSLISGNEDNAFRLVNSDMSIRTSESAQLSAARRSDYVMHIRVRDNGQPPLYANTYVHIKVIEESKYPPEVSPLEIRVLSYLDDFPGGVLGRVGASDQDPYDRLTYHIVSAQQQDLFSIDAEDGTLVSQSGLDVGSYLLNISVSDGKFSTTSAVRVTVTAVLDDALIQALIVRLDAVTAQDFLLTYKKGFLKGLRAALSVRTKDVELISVQSANLVSPDAIDNSVDISKRLERKSFATLKQHQISSDNSDSQLVVDISDNNQLGGGEINDDSNDVIKKRSLRNDLDVVFAIRKGQHGYLPAVNIRTKLKENIGVFEKSIGLKVIKISENRCENGESDDDASVAPVCDHGTCSDHIVLDRHAVHSVTADATAFVSPQHYRRLECICMPGFGGSRCETAVNECSRDPCLAPKLCIPVSSSLGYSCQCPHGTKGHNCHERISCTDPDCYEERHPITFSGRSYAHYSMHYPLDRRILFAAKIRTVQATGNIFYAVGNKDFSILEMVRGHIQYRFDCGSGEGLIRVTHRVVNDGLWHSVLLERRGNFARLVVDHKYDASGVSPGAHDLLDLDGSGIFLGAEIHPSFEHPESLIHRHHLTEHSHVASNVVVDIRPVIEADVRMGFVGCMDDVHVNGVALPLHVTGGSQMALLRRLVNVQFGCGQLFDPGACGQQPCANGGTCQIDPLNPRTNYTCTCANPNRFKGNQCELDLDPCASSPCLFGGICRNLERPNDFHCDCPTRLSGKRCEYGRFCNPTPCINGGICEEGQHSFVCKCPSGYQGNKCQTDINECLHRVCAEGATCENLEGGFKCVCPPNITGPYCTEHIIPTSITSSQLNITIEEAVAIVGIFVLCSLLAFCILCFFQYQFKRNRAASSQRRNPLELGVGNEMTDLYGQKQHQLLMEATAIQCNGLQKQTDFIGPLPDVTGASITHTVPPTSMQLNNLGHVTMTSSTRNSQSASPTRVAADATPSVQQQQQQLIQLKPLSARAGGASILPANSGTAVGRQGSHSASATAHHLNSWSAAADKDKHYEDKIQNDIKAPLLVKRPNKQVSSPSSLSSFNSDETPAPTILPAFTIIPPKTSSLLRAKGYSWDYSDLTPSQQPLTNIPEVVNCDEVREDSVSVQSCSTDSNGHVGNPGKTATIKRRTSAAGGCDSLSDFELPESEVTPLTMTTFRSPISSPDCGSGSMSNSPHLGYSSHLNDYLPSHNLSIGSTPDENNLEVAYVFPTQGGKGCRGTEDVTTGNDDSDTDEDTDNTVVRRSSVNISQPPTLV